MISYITQRTEYNDFVSRRGERAFAFMLANDFGFDTTKPIKVEVKPDLIEFWQTEDEKLIIPQNPVINGSQRRLYTGRKALIPC